MIQTSFTPAASLTGGVLIGLAASLLMLVHGRIFGVTGILAGLLRPISARDFGWRAALLAGMLAGPLVIRAATGTMPVVQVPVPAPALLIGGLLVGIGVTLASGCTSGHGVCGIARLSRRSVVATLTFMAAAFATVFTLRHLIGG